MIVSNTGQGTEYVKTLTSSHRATMQAAMLISPDGYGINQEAAADNRYIQSRQRVDLDRAQRQHDNLAGAIRRLGIPVITFPGRVGEPDGVFGNNVFATTKDNFIVGRMYHPSRQVESARQDIRNYFHDMLKRPLLDLSQGNAVAELTGALVIDRLRNFGICGISTRAEVEGAQAMHKAFGLSLTLNTPLKVTEYHINVVLAILAGKASIIAPSAFETEDVQELLSIVYGKNVIELDDKQRESFAANCISVTPTDVLMSQTGVDSLRTNQLADIERIGLTIHGVDVSEFEKAGGSLRCLVTEIF